LRVNIEDFKYFIKKYHFEKQQWGSLKGGKQEDHKSSIIIGNKQSIKDTGYDEST
jgi:hypothetical protein